MPESRTLTTTYAASGWVSVVYPLSMGEADRSHLKFKLLLSLIPNCVVHTHGLSPWCYRCLQTLGAKWLAQVGLGKNTHLLPEAREHSWRNRTYQKATNGPVWVKESAVVWVVGQVRALEPVWLPWWECRGAHLAFAKQPPVPGGDDVEIPKLILGNPGSAQRVGCGPPWAACCLLGEAWMPKTGLQVWPQLPFLEASVTTSDFSNQCTLITTTPSLKSVIWRHA